MKFAYKLYSYIGAIFRLLLLGLHFINGLVQLLIFRIIWGKEWYYSNKGAAVIQFWMKGGAWILGLRLHCCGEPLDTSAVMVSNHVSWLDIVAIAATTPVTFVSKSDLESWPVVGLLSKASGTLFIQRGSLFAVHDTLRKLDNVLSRERKTLFFPEGTTTIGKEVKRFHSGLFEAAYNNGCKVQPLVISYFHEGQPDFNFAPYVDKDHFLHHMWTFLVKGESDVYIDYLDTLSINDYARQQLARQCQDRISENLEMSYRIRREFPAAEEDIPCPAK